MKRLLVLIMIISLATVIAGGCGSSAKYIDFSKPAYRQLPNGDDNNEPAQRPILIALATVLSPDETIGSYRQIAQYISQQTGREAILIQRKTYAEVNLLLANGDVDIAFSSTGAYCSYRGMNEIELLVMAEHSGNSLYEAYIVVNKDSNIHSLEDLKGKVFAFTDPLSFSGHMVMVEYLQKQNTVPEKYFGRYFYTYSHDKSLWAVANKIADGASLDSQMYDYVKDKDPALVKNIRIIQTIGPAPTGPIVVSKRIKPEQKAQFREIFLRMHQDPEVAKAMQKLVIEQFVEPKPELYQPLKELYERTSGLL